MRPGLFCIPLVLLLSACSSSQPQISISQPLVMESDVLSAGITADGPTLGSDSGQQKATLTLYNDRDVAVTLHYRYFWYDDKGLEILPEQAAGIVVVPAHQSREAVSWSGNLSASQVRVSLYL